jgi:hypothetical protein
MNAQDISTFWTNPSFLFASNELSYAKLADVLQISNHAHPILCTISLVQAFEAGAGKAVALKAIFAFHLFTVFDAAADAVLRFALIVYSASGAGFDIRLIGPIGAAKKAIHPTGRNQFGVHYFISSRGL